MEHQNIKRVARLRDVAEFNEHLRHLNINIPCDEQVESGDSQPLASTLKWDDLTIGNRFCIQPMEGWDGTEDGHPTEPMRRRWKNFGLSGAKLIWGGEAAAVQKDGRANPNQLMINAETEKGVAELREITLQAHKEVMGNTDDLVIGLQLTHSGRFCRPNSKSKLEPKILYYHPILNPKFNIRDEYPLMQDGEIRELIQDYINAATRAANIGYDFVDIKHCHGYLGHEFLSAHTRKGDYGGSFENRTRFLREIVEGIRASVPKLKIGVRFSAFDTVSYMPDPSRAENGKLGPGIPDDFSACQPYEFGFGVDKENPLKRDLSETVQFLELLQRLNITGVNLSAGSPYYVPHVQRPALYPPSDGYQPPEDPLVGVARQLDVVRELKAQFPKLLFVGSAYSYLQEFLPNVAQAVIREGWVDSVGLGRMVLSYPDLPRDVLAGKTMQRKLICRTFSDCTTAPRNGIISGCYPLDAYYKKSEHFEALKKAKGQKP